MSSVCEKNLIHSLLAHSVAKLNGRGPKVELMEVERKDIEVITLDEDCKVKERTQKTAHNKKFVEVIVIDDDEDPGENVVFENQTKSTKIKTTNHSKVVQQFDSYSDTEKNTVPRQSRKQKRGFRRGQRSSKDYGSLSHKHMKCSRKSLESYHIDDLMKGGTSSCSGHM